MAFYILDSILAFAIFGLVQFLHNFGTCGLRAFEVCIDILDEYREALSLVSDLYGTRAPGSRTIDHDPGIAEMQLRALDPSAAFAIVVMLGEAERFRQPDQRIGDILICNVRQHNICRHGTVLQHDHPYSMEFAIILSRRRHCI